MIKKLFLRVLSTIYYYSPWYRPSKWIPLGPCVIEQPGSHSLRADVLTRGRQIRVRIINKNKDSSLIKLWKQKTDELKRETQSMEITGPCGHSMGSLFFHRVWPCYYDKKDVMLRTEPIESGEIWFMG